MIYWLFLRQPVFFCFFFYLSRSIYPSVDESSVSAFSLLVTITQSLWIPRGNFFTLNMVPSVLPRHCHTRNHSKYALCGYIGPYLCWFVSAWMKLSQHLLPVSRGRKTCKNCRLLACWGWGFHTHPASLQRRLNFVVPCSHASPHTW